MQIDKIELTNITVFKTLILNASLGINVIIGSNGTGKTHLLKMSYFTYDGINYTLEEKYIRKYELNKEGRKFAKTSNIIKMEKQIKLLHRKLANIRSNHNHQAANKIVKTKVLYGNLCPWSVTSNESSFIAKSDTLNRELNKIYRVL